MVGAIGTVVVNGVSDLSGRNKVLQQSTADSQALESAFSEQPSSLENQTTNSKPYPPAGAAKYDE